MDYLIILSCLTFFSVCLTATFFKIFLDKNKITNELILKNQNLITINLNQMKGYQTMLLSELAKNEKQNDIKISEAVIQLNEILNSKHTNLNLFLDNNTGLIKLAIKNTTDDLKKELHEVYSGIDSNNSLLNKKLDTVSKKITDLSQLEEIK